MSTLSAIAGRLAARTPVRGPAAPFASVALLVAPLGFDPASPDLQLLLIERAEREGDPWSGHMALPGGRIDPGDAHARAAAIRETREEIDVRVGEPDFLGELDDVYPRERQFQDLVIRPFVFAVRSEPTLALSDEVAKALWVPLAELTACACEAEVDYRGGKISVPAYRCGPHVVWGLTHRIVSGLIELVDPGTCR